MLDNVSETLVFNNFYPLGLLSVFADAFHFWDNWHANFEVVFNYPEPPCQGTEPWCRTGLVQ